MGPIAEEPGDASNHELQEAGSPERGEAGGGLSVEGRRKDLSSPPEAATSRKKQLRRASRRTVLTGGITCVVLVAGVGLWSIRNHQSADGDHPLVGPSPSSTVQDNSMKRLREAQKGEGKKWRIGVKRGRPGHGIGLNKNAIGLKNAICDAMKTKKVMEAANELYGPLPGGEPVTQDICSSS